MKRECDPVIYPGVWTWIIYKRRRKIKNKDKSFGNIESPAFMFCVIPGWSTDSIYLIFWTWVSMEHPHFTAGWQEFHCSHASNVFGTKKWHIGLQGIDPSCSILFALCFPLRALQRPQLARQWLLPRPWIRAAPVRDLLNLKNSRTPQEHLITFALKAMQPVLWQHTQDSQGCADMASEFSPDYHKPDTNYPKQNMAIEPWFISPPHNSTCPSIAESCHLLQAERFTKVQAKVIVVYIADSYRMQDKISLILYPL